MLKLHQLLTMTFAAMALHLATTAPVSAERIRVVAVVDGEAITSYDVENRLAYLLEATGLKLNDDNEAQLNNDALQMLIDDKIKLSEGRKVAPNLISAARETAIRIVNENYASNTQTANQRLSALGIDRQIVEDKYLADVIWANLLRDKFKSQFDNSVKLAEQSLERVKRNLSQPQIRISEIVLPPAPDRPTSMNLDIARQMIDAIKEGADFGAIARQYSAAGSAADGGRLNWLVVNTLPKAFTDPLEQAATGEVLAPINIDGVVYILRKDGVRAKGLIDPSQTKVTIARALLPLPAEEDEAGRLIAAGTMQKRTQGLSTCDDISALNDELASGQPSYLRDLELGSITPNLRQIIEKLDLNMPSEPLLFAEGIVVFMVCKRVLPEMNLPSIEELEREELNKLFSLLSNRYLLRLRRASTIEIR